MASTKATHEDPQEDTELPRKKVKVGIQGSQDSNADEGASNQKNSEQQGEETDPHQTKSSSKDNNSAEPQDQRSNNNNNHNDNNDNNNHPAEEDNNHDNNNNQNNQTEDTTSTTTQQSTSSTSDKPYSKEDIVWNGNFISDESWGSIPRFESWRLSDVSEGDKEFERDLIEIYRSTCEEKLPMLKDALDQEDHDNSVLYSHDIKGSSSNIGAELIRAVSERIEHLCRAKNYSAAKECLPQLRKALDDTNITFDKYLE